MNKIFKNLALDTLIFALGSGSALLISFFMVPWYTSVLSTFEFGVSDLIVTTVNMLLPVVSLNIFAAVFRWGLDEKGDESNLFSNGFLVSSIGGISAVIIGIVSIFCFSNYLWAIALNIGGAVWLNFFQNFYRGIGQVKLYIFSGLVRSICNALLNITLMFIFKFGLFGYLLSMILSNYFGVLFLIIFGKATEF